MVTRQNQTDASAIDWDEVLTPPQHLAAATQRLANRLAQLAIAYPDSPISRGRLCPKGAASRIGGIGSNFIFASP